MGLTRTRWLIPAALGFLALAVLFAVVMLAYPCGAGASQRWRSVPAGDAVTLVNVASGKCLDVNGASTGG